MVDYIDIYIYIVYEEISNVLDLCLLITKYYIIYKQNIFEGNKIDFYEYRFL